MNEQVFDLVLGEVLPAYNIPSLLKERLENQKSLVGSPGQIMKTLNAKGTRCLH